MAVIAELIDNNNRIHMQVNSKKGAPAPKPLKIPRPWDKPKVKRKATSEDMKAIFGGNAEYVPAETG